MNAQQLHDYIIKPTLEYMGGNYYSKESAFLLLATAAIESNCGEYIKQIGGPALGIWQMEPTTHDDMWINCDALCSGGEPILNLGGCFVMDEFTPIEYPLYACAMARLKYSMDPNSLPKLTSDKDLDSMSFYGYYKRVYNTELGASTYEKWVSSLEANKIWSVKL